MEEVERLAHPLSRSRMTSEPRICVRAIKYEETLVSNPGRHHRLKTRGVEIVAALALTVTALAVIWLFPDHHPELVHPETVVDSQAIRVN